jgi:molybdopterin-containing oxidoreductase family membrane subunit
VLDKVARLIGWALVVYLYMRFWDMLSVSYTYSPARTEATQMLTGGLLAFNFWIGEIVLGIAVPIILLLLPPFRSRRGFQTLALLLVVGGVVAYRWDTNMVGQLVVVSRLPHILEPLYTHYFPSLIEFAAGAGVIAYGLLAFSIGVRYFRVVEHESVVAAGANAETEPQPVLTTPKTA